MPLKKENFVTVYNNIPKQVDVDDSRGRSVPSNMNFIETGFLTKDTGCSLLGATTSNQVHSLFNYKKKDGTSYFIRGNGTALQRYNSGTGVWDNISTIGTATITIASPGVITKVGHGLATDSNVTFTTTGALPTGIVAGTVYYAVNVTADTFQIAATLGGTAINTSGTQSGVHTISHYFTAGAKFGWVVYDNILYGCNGVEQLITYDGSLMTKSAAAPKGNILEIFEDRLFISGVTSGNNSVGTATMTVASPAVVTKTLHRLTTNDKIFFTTTGALPTGVTSGVTYYVIATGLTIDSFQFSATLGGAAVNTSGSQSGVHSLYVQEKPQPLILYFSNVGLPLVWTNTDFSVPLGTDAVTGLKNYYGTLLVFKKESIWKLVFEYSQIYVIFIPKLTIQSSNYGACARNAIYWVENDIWFFTGTEVRSIGFKDQQTGVFGVNKSVISEQIKETLKTISTANYADISTFYYNRRFYLSVPTGLATNDTVFVCHLLFNNVWTKYKSRIKASALDFIQVDNVIYSTKSVTPFGVIKWDNALLADNGSAISSEVFFQKVEEQDFNKFVIYRYLDLMFKDLVGKVTVTIKSDANDLRTTKTNQFFVGSSLENELSTLGEVNSGEGLVADGFGQTVEASPFQKKRISFLSKAQTLTIGLSNAALSEEFTIAEYALSGHKEPRKMFKPGSIISLA